MKTSKRPNILLIHSDQHRFDCLGVNGHPHLQTPNLDRLAGGGVNFTSAFTPAPICTPERASLMTGQWPTQHGSINIHGQEGYRPAPATAPVFPVLLSQAGYRLGYVGKYHAEMPGPPTDFGFHEYVPTAAYNEWRSGQHLPPLPKTGWFGGVDEAITGEQSRLAWGAGRIVEMMRRFAGEHSGPFMLRWDPVEPHLPCNPPPEFAAMYPAEKLQPWKSLPDPLANKPMAQVNQLRRWDVRGWTWQQWAPVVSRYLAIITLMDQQIGRVLSALDELGLAGNTLVVYSTDHGDMCGAHGMMDKNFQMYDDTLRVPLIMRWPGVLPAGASCDEFVCHAIDLASTFCSAAGVAAPDTFRGQDLLPVAAGRAGTGRSDIFASYHGSQMGLYSQRMVRDRAWKYVYNATDRHELYCLQRDPFEMVNRIDDSSCRDELARLRQRLIAWMEQNKDPLLNGWTRRDLQ